MSIMDAKNKRLIVILGPTASGKSDLAVILAGKYNGEVISADSRQVYKGLDIASGKITRREMRGVRHHLLNVVLPRQIFTASRYRALARRAARDIISRGKLPIVAGGTGLYIDTFLYDHALPAVPPDKKMRARLEKESVLDLYKQLLKLDPRRAGNVEPKNKRRLVRALEIILKTGKPVPAISDREPIYPALKIGIALPPAELKKRIHTRLVRRMKQGMPEEIRKLHENGISWKRLDELGLECRYVSRYLRGLISREEMMNRIENESWKYARRQMTWWRKDKGIEWVRTKREAVALVKRLIRA